MAKYDDINSSLVATVGLISVLAVTATIIGVQVLYQSYQRSEEQRKVLLVEPVEAKNLLAEQEARLSRSGWLDRENNIIAIPIERAMKLVVEELREPDPRESDDG